MRQRRICTKSHYKMTCGCCGNTIHRGDLIPQVLGSKGRMRARKCRAPAPHWDVDFSTAVADAESGCYTPYAYAPTRNRWVHLTCRPQFYKDWGYGLSEGYFPHPTAYSDDIERRLTAASMDPDWGEDISAIPHPEWRWQTERLAEAIIPLQRKVKKNILKYKEAEAEHRFIQQNSKGDHCEILFDQGKKIEAIYSCEVTHVGRLGCLCDGVITVKYHHDGEIRHYNHRRWMKLKKECDDYKKKLGIEATITGKLPTSTFYLVFKN